MTQDFNRIGGWLCLPAIGLIITPFRFAYGLYELSPVFKYDFWDAASTPGSEIYHPLWKPVIFLEAIGNLFFLVFSIVLIALFFKRKTALPKLIIAYLLTNLTYILTDAYLGSQLPIEGGLDLTVKIRVLATTIAAIVWVSYFLVSKRVKRTFVR